MVYAFTWAVTVLVRHSKTKVGEKDTEEVPVMRDVQQIAQQLNKQTVHQSTLNKAWMVQPMRWPKEMVQHEGKKVS